MTVAERTWTEEQRRAIERRDGDLLLDAAAGSGKTSVLVERFARTVLQDGVDVAAILAITFTEKAAAELRERIRARLRELGAPEAAQATEGAFISTIHGFCARVLRAHALQAGLDPRFEVLDRSRSGPLAAAAFDAALAEQEGVVELIAAYGAPTLRSAIVSVHDQLRSAGELAPRLPALAPADDDGGTLRAQLRDAAFALAGELGAIDEPGVKVVEALRRLGGVADLGEPADVWPADLWRLSLPRNGAALSTDACLAYTEALTAFRVAAAVRAAGPVRDRLDALLERFAARYAAAKQEISGVDFEDLELLTRRLVTTEPALRDRYAARFDAIMVDELQDSNRVQLELIEAIATDNLFTVGDAQQSIYGFRHADVELFRARGRRLGERGARETLRTNFRTRPEIIDVLNPAFTEAMGEDFTPLRAGRDPVGDGEPRVELMIADKGADWDLEGLASPWRLAEARALADRVAQLVADGAAPAEIVVLLRATTDMRAYERALERRGLPTYVIGGRGYWAHPQVVDMVGYLRALANPREEEALYGVLASPLGSVSMDGLVILASAARAARRDPWALLRDPAALPADLSDDDRAAFDRFAAWFGGERARAARAGVEALLDRALLVTGYDLAMLELPGGPRRLANVRKLMRLGREHEALHGPDLHGFLAALDERAASPESGREGEAPVEGEGLDAIRLMTIHRAKGLEFPIVCVADLGRSPRPPASILRVAPGSEPGTTRLGLRLARAGAGGRESALEYSAIGEELRAADEREERRLFYVAMTRARERLILSGAAKLDGLAEGNPRRSGGGPVAWIAPALVEDLPGMVAAGGGEVACGEGRVAVTLSRPEAEGAAAVSPDVDDRGAGSPDTTQPPAERGREPFRPSGPETFPAVPPAPPPSAALAGSPVATLSYSALADYHRCGYRFYTERVLGLAAAPDDDPPAPERTPEPVAGRGPDAGRRRGVLVHALLERMDFRHPVVPGPDVARAAAARARLDPPPGPEELDGLAGVVRAFAASPLCARLAAATEVRREQRFAFALSDDPGDPIIVGALDVLARERGGLLVVDYKTDRIGSASPEAVVRRGYRDQQLVYGLAALHAGAQAVQVVHCFLQAPDRPVVAAYERSEMAGLAERLRELAAGIGQRRFPVAPDPHRHLCAGCPAQDGLCSWPPELTRRESADTLF